MIGLQEMLMQTVVIKIYLLPAWLKDWVVNFTLHAPKDTNVELIYQDSKVDDLEVSSSIRQKDNGLIFLAQKTLKQPRRK